MINKKHKFVHLDPEQMPGKPKSDEDKNKKNVTNKEIPYIKEDLKKSVITISIFVFVLIVFYLINGKYDLLSYIKNFQF